MAVLYVDLDHFKAINDTLGHAVGDKVLVEAANRLQSSVRHSDTVARLGGDEFTAILTEVSNAEGVRVVADRIVRELARSFAVDGSLLHVSASVGIALSPVDGDVPDELLRRADEALFRAKAKRNHYEFYSEVPACSA
jgi:diguanylate cyclase (GGDEF)-like protein